jgi:taurine dioxygenase
MSGLMTGGKAQARELRRDYASFTVSPVTPVIGAEVNGLDLSQELDEAQQNELRQAFLDHSVLVFRDQELSREDHKRTGRIFGELHVHPLNAARGVGDYDGRDPEILVVKTTKESKYTAGNGWHTDVTCDARPPLGSMLYITEVPEIGCGGDTSFTSTYAACDALSDSFKGYLRTLTAVHDGALPYTGAYGYVPQEGSNHPRSEHPVIGLHPETGREILYVNSGFTTHIKGLARKESDALLSMLFEHIATGVRFQCRISWQPNTLVFWDNRCTQHHASWDYYPHSRYGERVSIVGDPPGPTAVLAQAAE